MLKTLIKGKTWTIYFISGHFSLKLRPHTDGDGVVTDLLIIPDLSFSQDFPPTLQQVEGPFMAETLLGDFHFYITNILCNIHSLQEFFIDSQY